MFTSSGAEGINLKNTRFVHIMEPYWNFIRIDQVFGRAIRMMSHVDLPEDKRFVEQYLYLSRHTVIVARGEYFWFFLPLQKCLNQVKYSLRDIFTSVGDLFRAIFHDTIWPK